MRGGRWHGGATTSAAGRGSRLAAAVAVGGLAMTLAACGGLEAARGSCEREGVGDVRCAAIVDEAAAHLEEYSPPTVGVEVRMADAGDRQTLRDQRLVAFVTFAFLDGSRREVRVFCRPALDPHGVCRVGHGPRPEDPSADPLAAP